MKLLAAGRTRLALMTGFASYQFVNETRGAHSFLLYQFSETALVLPFSSAMLWILFSS
jgi:hypothetical protein